MFFRDIVGQENAKRELIRNFETGQLPHARLFVGEDGAGGLALAYAYARYINCLAPTPEDACGQCRSCLRYNDYASQDLLYLFPIINVDSRNLCEDNLPQWREYLSLGAHARYSEWLSLISSESKRPAIFSRESDNLVQRLSYQIAEARYRILLIWLPERMQEALANKLLKLTEEPPPNTIILMATQQEAGVLGTLRSRMQTTYLRPLPQALIASQLASLPKPSPTADPMLSAHLAGGNYRTALDDYTGQTEDADEMTTLFGRILRATVNARPMEIKALSEELAKLNREEQIALLSYASRMFREIYIHPLGVEQLNYLTPTELGIVKYLSGCITTELITPISEEIDLAIRHILQNVNSRMVLFDLILRLTSTLASSYKQRGIR